MNITMILEMATSAGDRVVVTVDGRSLTASELLDRARAAAHRFRHRSAVLYLGANHLAHPVALFGAALAGVPFIPLNYRLGEHQLTRLLDRHPGALVLRADDLDELLQVERETGRSDDEPAPQDQDAIAVVLYTSGTTAEPKAAVLRHRHLLAYVFNTQEFGSAEPDAATLVAVPPYHVAGLMNLLTNLYSGRRIVYQSAFDAPEWLAAVRRERVTHALVVPTMLARIVAEVPDGATARTPTLRSLAYGGARTPRPLVERALRIFPDTGFVNAYGLTETTSSIAVLGPDDHREALVSDEPAVRDRLGSVGRALPGVEIQIRDQEGRQPAQVGTTGLVFVRGDQISGEYGGRAAALDGDGWFATRDRGRLDADGYLFIEGRADDTIIRGGENIAPAEIEDVLLTHPGIVEAAVIGLPDPEWGQRIVAVLVGTGDPEEIRAWVRDRLRSAKTPDTVVFRAELPKTDTGKLLRRTLLADLETTHA
ncbi:class I adenylate-forming enzyme family protein [Streptomyces sp. WI04-05B]|uniref:class I adenylate-forming enzyme family protein n=1 Tax=Streptomyces TaxID=1883 RepID=UPI0029A6D6BA|nr:MULTISPECIES: AMP-binding protein [unclassified Streptomyces]MDX2541565.1 AMP-binding protein [Streptomyces sp. WI04-05B]MDX2583701.1 AMP-binding protein [Streptomyces sp. WI04-05A]